MCRFKTPESQQKICGRCGEVANPDDGWEHGWPLYGKIDLGFPSQIFGALCGADNCAETHHFKWWQEEGGHPAMTKNDAQGSTFEWKHTNDWRLCYNCQKELIKVIGKFFKIPERAEELNTDNADKKKVEEILDDMNNPHNIWKNQKDLNKQEKTSSNNNLSSKDKIRKMSASQLIAESGRTSLTAGRPFVRGAYSKQNKEDESISNKM